MDLEDELKRLFQDDRLDVQVAADAEKTVVAGARRTYRRRTALISAAGVLSAAVLATGTVILTRGPEQSTVADHPSLSITTGPSSVVSPGPLPGTEAPAPPISAPTSVSTPGAGSPPTINSRTTIKGPPSATSHPPSSPVTATLIGSASYGPFTLGMSDADVQALIQANGVKTSAGCNVYQIPGQNGSQLVVSPAKGLVTIAPVASKLTTPEGVGTGSTPEQLKAKYPDYVDGANPAKVSARNGDFYYFSMSAGSTPKVTGIKLVRGEDC